MDIYVASLQCEFWCEPVGGITARNLLGNEDNYKVFNHCELLSVFSEWKESKSFLTQRTWNCFIAHYGSHVSLQTTVPQCTAICKLKLVTVLERIIFYTDHSLEYTRQTFRQSSCLCALPYFSLVQLTGWRTSYTLHICKASLLCELSCVVLSCLRLQTTWSNMSSWRAFRQCAVL